MIFALQLLDEQESADEEFWNQEFFAEEEKDREFEASESEEEDVPDTDFSESVRLTKQSDVFFPLQNVCIFCV